MDSIFRIGKRSITVQRRSLSAEIWEDEGKSGIGWQLNVEGQEIDIGATKVAPRLYTEDLRSLARPSYENIPESLNVKSDDMLGVFLYFTDHIEIKEGKIQILDTKDSLHLNFEGRADLNWGRGLGRNVKIKIDAPLTLDGIFCYGKDEKKRESLLKEFFPNTDFFREEENEKFTPSDF